MLQVCVCVCVRIHTPKHIYIRLMLVTLFDLCNGLLVFGKQI